MTFVNVSGTVAARFGLVLGAMLLGPAMSVAAPITYTVNQSIGLGSVTGTIQTDGALGALGSADILAWNLNLNGVGATYNLLSGSSVVQIVGADLTATASNLSFNFSGADSGYLLFQQTLFSGQHYYCDATDGNVCLPGATVAPQAYTDPSAQIVAQSGTQVIATVAAAIPEPASLAFLAFGLTGLAAARRVGRNRARRQGR